MYLYSLYLYSEYKYKECKEYNEEYNDKNTMTICNILCCIHNTNTKNAKNTTSTQNTENRNRSDGSILNVVYLQHLFSSRAGHQGLFVL